MLEIQPGDGSTLIAKHYYREEREKISILSGKKTKIILEDTWKTSMKGMSEPWRDEKSHAHIVKLLKNEENSTEEGFSNEEIKELKDLLGTFEKPFELCSLALLGNVSCMSVSYSANSCIVESGATVQIIGHTPLNSFILIPISKQ